MKRRYLFGFFMVLLGVYLLLNQMNIIPYGIGQIFSKGWPILLILLGLSSLRDGARDFGAWALIVIGVFFTLRNFFPWFRDISLWPVILIALGIFLILSRTTQKEVVKKECQASDQPKMEGEFRHADSLHESVLLNSKTLRLITEDFQGGKVSSTLGSFKLDLSEVNLQQDALLQIEVLLGEADIILPKNHKVEIRGSEFLGDFKGGQPQQEFTSLHRLLIEYNATLGSIKFY